MHCDVNVGELCYSLGSHFQEFLLIDKEKQQTVKLSPKVAMGMKYLWLHFLILGGIPLPCHLIFLPTAFSQFTYFNAEVGLGKRVLEVFYAVAGIWSHVAWVDGPAF